MKKINLFVLFIGLNSITIVSSGQARPVPAAVTTTFNKMFPDAGNVEWKDKMTNFAAFFNIRDKKCEAKFNVNGDWISTEKSISLDSLPPAVRDGLKSSKYADWQETSSYILRLPGEVVDYHVVVAKSDLGRKILFFHQNGQLYSEH